MNSTRTATVTGTDERIQREGHGEAVHRRTIVNWEGQGVVRILLKHSNRFLFVTRDKIHANESTNPGRKSGVCLLDRILGA